MLLLGSRAPGRHTEQHDIFFGIGENIKALIPAMHLFWPEARKNMHVDAWREVSSVDGYHIMITERKDCGPSERDKQLFFINLGGYQQGIFDELHFKILTVQKNKAQAVLNAKATPFYKEVHFTGANSHIDDQHGVDVDEIYKVNDILPASQKEKFILSIIKSEAAIEDQIHIGYFKLSSFK